MTSPTPSPAPPYQPPPDAAATRFSGLAWSSLILGIVGIVFSPLPIINNLSALAAVVARRRHPAGHAHRPTRGITVFLAQGVERVVYLPLLTSPGSYSEPPLTLTKPNATANASPTTTTAAYCAAGESATTCCSPGDVVAKFARSTTTP